ncbi:hypothetical protein H4R33_001515 [Dimargaris cristalligena]|nr:hypothetical protein H4R33_001515 [Dimargaris cristalligena]
MANVTILEHACRHVHQAADPCLFIRTECADVSGMVNYLEIYYCQTPLLHGLTLVLFLGWLCFLFTWVGISASDYFSPNLTSLAKYFHIPDSLAGVTLLAFGNGAPDLFATFSAIRSGSGALALGELVGAAAFIACVVAGCMLILYPFQVSVVPFLREVIFFALTLSITTWIAWDRKVTLWEGVSLIVFYIIYVLVVMISTWMEKKYFTRRFLIDQARAEYVDWGQAQDLDLYNQLTNAGHEYNRHAGPSVRLSESASERSASSPIAPIIRINSGDSISSQPSLLMHPDDEDSDSVRSELVPLVPKYSPHRLSPGALPPVPRSPIDQDEMIQPNAWLRRKSLLSAIEFRDFLSSLPLSPNAPPLASDTEPLPRSPHRQPNLSMSDNRLYPTASYAPNDHYTRSKSDAGPSNPLRISRNAPLAEPSTSSSMDISSPIARNGIPQLIIHPSTPKSSEASLNSARSTSPEPSSPSPAHLGHDLTPPHRNRPVGLRLEIPRTTSSRSLLSVENSLLSAISPRSVDDELPLTTPGFVTPGSAYSDYFGSAETSSHPSPSLSPLPNHQLHSSEPMGQVTSLPLPSPCQQSDASQVLSRVQSDPFTHRVATSLETGTQDSQSWLPRSPYSAPAAGVPARFEKLRLTGYHTSSQGTTVGPPTPLPAEVVENDLFNRQRSATYDSDEADSASDTPAEMAPTIGPWVDAHLPLARVGHLARLLVISLRCVIIPAFIAYAFDHIFEWEAPWVIYVGLALGAVSGLAFASVSLPKLTHQIGMCFLQLWRLIRTSVLFRRRSEFPSNDPSRATSIHSSTPVGREPRIAQHPLAWVARSPSIRTLLPACVGFVSGISWVYLTADEVVALLQSLGIILNISEGILGLTVLALGNSLGDFMTNLTIARMGLPAMALSACFGGPMLNILLGIGISATTLTSTTQGNYPLPVSNTVFVSSLGTIFCMLVMLFWVPANNYRMTRGLGFILIFVYCLCMGINMVLEYNDENHHGH